MDFLFWRKNRVIDSFASGLADEFYSQVQPGVAEEYFQGNKAQKGNMKKKTKLHSQVENALNDLCQQVNFFRDTHSLGIYGKARVHLSFTERLKELGYAGELANRINEFLLLKTP